MINAVVFSRDRACQLDLLLTSLEHNAPGLFDINVIWMAKFDPFREAYEICAKEHPKVLFIQEDGLTYQVRSLALRKGGLATFFTDDDVLYQPVASIPELRDDWICFSLRLGTNTTYCYPHARKQRVPDALTWEWRRADADFGYPMSLDGHIFRASDLDPILRSKNFANPNFLEEIMMAGAPSLNRPYMTCFEQSKLVGVPVNRVNTARPNRHGEDHPYSVAELNEQYLLGRRISLEDLDFSNITGAHQEMELLFK